MNVPDQRVVSVKRRTFLPASCGVVQRRTLALFLSIALSTPAFAQDAGVLDAPTAVRLDSGLVLNPAAEKKLDDELKRLQGVERQHKGESWVTVVLVSLGVGLVLGAATGVAVTLAVKPAPGAPPSSP